MPNKNPKQPFIYIDFDETIFNHRALLVWLDKVWQQHYGKEPGLFKNTINLHHEEVIKNHRFYDHRSHYKLTGKSWDEVSKNLTKLIDEEAKDFCFPETHKIVSEIAKTFKDVHILTFGDAEYQNYKIGFCKHLAILNLSVRVVDERKGDFLEREHKEEFGVLVDDKYPLNLPAGWTHIWINRQSSLSKPKKLADELWQISDLGQLQKTLHKITLTQN